MLLTESIKDELKTLLDVARIQNTSASNRIEGIFISDKRLNELVNKKSKPNNRSEQEITGYCEVLTTIHESYKYILVVNSSQIEFFRLYRYLSILCTDLIPKISCIRCLERGFYKALSSLLNLSLSS